MLYKGYNKKIGKESKPLRYIHLRLDINTPYIKANYQFALYKDIYMYNKSDNHIKETMLIIFMILFWGRKMSMK